VLLSHRIDEELELGVAGIGCFGCARRCCRGDAEDDQQTKPELNPHDATARTMGKSPRPKSLACSLLLRISPCRHVHRLIHSHRVPAISPTIHPRRLTGRRLATLLLSTSLVWRQSRTARRLATLLLSTSLVWRQSRSEGPPHSSAPTIDSFRCLNYGMLTIIYWHLATWIIGMSAYWCRHLERSIVREFVY